MSIRDILTPLYPNTLWLITMVAVGIINIVFGVLTGSVWNFVAAGAVIFSSVACFMMQRKVGKDRLDDLNEAS